MISNAGIQDSWNLLAVMPDLINDESVRFLSLRLCLLIGMETNEMRIWWEASLKVFTCLFPALLSNEEMLFSDCEFFALCEKRKMTSVFRSSLCPESSQGRIHLIVVLPAPLSVRARSRK